MRVISCILKSPYRQSLNLVRMMSGAPHKLGGLFRDKCLVNGEWIGATSGKTFPVENPSTLEILADVPDMDPGDVSKATDAAWDAFQTWQYTTPTERAKILYKWYNLMYKHKNAFMDVVTRETGKPLNESAGELYYGASYIEFYAEEAKRLKGEILASSMHKSKKLIVERCPIGPVALITPWNFPFAMIVRKAATALAVGCTVVVKPSEYTPLTALATAAIAEEAGFPKGVFNVITSSVKNSPAVGNFICTSPKLAGISFTGSTNVGKILYKNCASTVKRMSLELGGNAPFIVFESANLKKALDGAYFSKLRNCGQACTASNRFYICEKHYDAFLSRISEMINNLKLGFGTEQSTQLGPIINKVHFKRVLALVEDAKKKGAKIHAGGVPAPDIGPLFFKPTVITNVTKDMQIFDEEIFGPIFVIHKFKTEEEVLAKVNSSRFGLAGYFYSEDIQQIFRVAKKLETGIIGVNEGIVSAAEAPFGGIKESGMGREGSDLGLNEFLYVKYICLGGLQ